MLHTRREVQADQRLKNVSLVATLRTRRLVETPFLRHDETLKAWESRFGDTKATALYPQLRHARRRTHRDERRERTAQRDEGYAVSGRPGLKSQPATRSTLTSATASDATALADSKIRFRVASADGLVHFAEQPPRESCCRHLSRR